MLLAAITGAILCGPGFVRPQNLGAFGALDPNPPLETWLDSMDVRVGKTVSRLMEVPTGRSLAVSAAESGVKITIDGSAYYDPAANTIHLDEDSSRNPALVAHELEHARQRVFGVRAGRRAELGAYSMEGRVWVELGAPLRKDGSWLSSVNDGMLQLWVRHPMTAYWALGLRRTADWPPISQPPPADSGDASPEESYWLELSQDECRWREMNAGKLAEIDAPPSALTEQLAVDLSFAKSGRSLGGGITSSAMISEWMPEFLEELLLTVERGGRSLEWPLPGAPTALDRELLSRLGRPNRVTQTPSGQWILQLSN
ncbi:MAG: hypothetical protein A3G41_08905 [Elusimicrobia bacterium RIFCSPLOWO2_12_FULL_59_9]|nr:MAG: hypothetical protein A3G41_08905 [Elusimicrobia bacterium RIFCSPLOWO2_12_FULL_59_9]